MTVYFNTYFKNSEQVKHSYTAPLDVSTFDILTRETVFRKVFKEMLTGSHFPPFFACSLFHCSPFSLICTLTECLAQAKHVGKLKS